MTTITRFTKEQLISRINKQIDINATIIERLGDDSAATSKLAVKTATMDMKILDVALASLAAELVDTFRKVSCGHAPLFHEDAAPLYTATPAPAMSPAATDVLAERQRQTTAEGWTPEHDDEHACEEMAAFAALYAMPPACREWEMSDKLGYGDTLEEAICPDAWVPKFGDRRRELVKAGALILAEIERLDRAAGVGIKES